MDAGIGTTRSRGALAGVLYRAIDALEGVLGEDPIVTNALGFEQSAIGAEADVAQLG